MFNLPVFAAKGILKLLNILNFVFFVFILVDAFSGSIKTEITKSLFTFLPHGVTGQFCRPCSTVRPAKLESSLSCAPD